MRVEMYKKRNLKFLDIVQKAAVIAVLLIVAALDSLTTKQIVVAGVLVIAVAGIGFAAASAEERMMRG